MKKRLFSRLTALVLTALMLVGVLPIAVWADASDFSYYISTDADGEYAVINSYHGDGGDVTIPAEIDGLPVRQIGYGVFDSRRDIGHVTVSEGIEQLGGNVFSWSSVSSVSLPSTLIGISSQCFNYCKELTEITIPEGVTLIGDGLFEGCESLTDVYFEASAPQEDWDGSWANMCYADIWFGGVLRSECVRDEMLLYRVENKQATVLDFVPEYDLNRISVPETVGDATVTAIGVCAFKDVHGIVEIELPETVTVIANDAFLSCSSLERVNLPLGLTEIGYRAFMWCTKLQELRIPETVSYIDFGAFAYSYVNLYFEAEAPSADWNENWQSDFWGSTVWGACVHRNVTVDEVKKTCYEDGYLRITCDDCGEEVRYEYYEASHDYDNGVCTVCGDTLPVTALYNYWIDGDIVVISDYYGDDEHVIVPAWIEGYPVGRIGDWAFDWQNRVKSVTLPETVTSVGPYAFYYSSVADIYCPSGADLSGWDPAWARDCSANVWAGSELVSYVGEQDGFVYRITDGCVMLTGCTVHTSSELVIPAELAGCPVTGIGYEAFSYMEALTSVVIPETVTAIGAYAFSHCGVLTEITVPASVETMGGYVFMRCNSMQNVYCEAAEQPEQWDYYWAYECNADIWFDGVMKRGEIDGFLFAAEGGAVTILDYVGDARDIVIPAELSGMPVTRIGDQAFEDLSEVTAVTIPDTVTEIGHNAFAGCYALTEITIPASAEVVGYHAFWDCSVLQNIYCEAAEQPGMWDYYWADGCNANIWFDGVMKSGVLDGIKFVTENNTVKLLDYLGDATEIVIPSEISGLPVTIISDQAFAWLDGVTSITIPDTVEIISYEAFAYNDSLAEITIPASVAHMSDDVFYQCTNLQNIYCASAEQPYDWSYNWSAGCNANIWFDGVLSVGIVDGFKVQNVDGQAAILDYVGNATEIVIPAEIGGMPVVAIEARAFADLYEVTSIVIPDSVYLIGYGAFADCTSLTEITIPASVEFMHTEVFCNDTALQNIYCEATEQPDTWDRYWMNGCDANIWFDGVLTQGVSGDYRITVEDGEVRITDYLGSAAEIVIPSEIGGMPVTSIGYNAFSNSDEATSITIPDSVTEIASYAFAWCYALTEITIPASVKWVEYDVFYECNALQNIYCEAESQPDGWVGGWTNGCSANIYFDGVLTQGVIDDFRISITDSGIKILRYLGLESEVVIPFAFGDLPVICIGNSAFSDLYDVTAITIPDSVTEIESYAFARCYELTEITIPASVAVIGDEVFWECSDLQNIYCASAEQPFEWSEIWANGCNANVWFDGVLTQGTVDGFVFKTVDGGISIQGYVGDAWDIVIPAEIGGLPVTKIESYAFAYRYDTTSVSIPDGVTYIGSRAFAENYALARINIPDSVKEIGGYAFLYCNSLTEITIPASVEIMGTGVFRDCYSIQNIYCEAVSRPEKWHEYWSTGCNANIYFDGVMTQGVSGNYQFKTENGEVTILDYVGDAYGLTELVIPSEIGGMPVTSIGSGAFADLYEMKSVSIPDSVHTIEYNAFAWCHALTEVTIPASVTTMGSGVFWDCQSLQSIYCEAAEPTEQWDLYWTDGCNANLYFDGVLKRGVVDGYLITTENGEVTILDCAGGFGGVTELVIPSELCGMPVTTIASSAFAGMSELTGIIIPDSVHTIYDNAFAYCVSLKEITIPASVKQISYYLFDGCPALENIYCEAASRPDEWNSSWANGCDANVWFDGVLTRGTVGDYVIIVEEGAVTILAYTGSASVVEIPSELNGLPVVGIGNSAFADMDHLTEVIIPDSVMSIGYEAFAYCDGLTEMTIPESVLLMDADVFWNSTNIENIYCEAKTEPEGWRYGWVNACNADVYFDGVLTRGVSDSFCFSVKDGSLFITGYLGSVSELVIPGEIHGYPVVGIASGALSYREDIESVVLPASLRYIEGYAFEECHSLSSVVIPDGVVEICDCAFGWCYQLTEITIPASVTVLGGSVFVECNSLQNIYCEAASLPENWNRNWANGCDANIYFDGVLMQGIVGDYKITAENGEVTILEYVGSEAQVQIPAEIGGMPVTSIGRRAFAGFDGITEVIIPDSVASIGYEAFAYCNGLTEMTIPASVLYMDDDVFWDSRNLQNIYCKAASRPEGWSYGWDNACGANIYFDDLLAKGVVGDYRVEFEDGNTKIVGYLGIESELEIPAEIEGKPVTYIDYEAFAYNENLISVTIPASVAYMGGSVFYDCINLQNIYCEAEEEPDDWSYNWTNGCNANVYYDGVLLRGVAEGCKFFVNDGVVILTDYVGTEQEAVTPAEITGLPVVAIEAGAFAGGDMTSVVIPDSVGYIGYEAFADCDFLKEITIPASVKYMDGDVFWNCDNLQTIYCESGEHIAEWSSGWAGGCNAEIYVEGVLTVGMIDDYRVDISGEGAVILGYFGNDTGIVVPAELGGKTVVEIGSNAFAECYYLTEITIPASVVYIGSYAFSGSEELKNIYLAPDADIESWPGNWYINCEADVWKGDELITAWDSNYRVMLLESGAMILDYVGDGGDLIVPETLAGKPVVKIGRKAFDYLDSLTSIVLPDSIVSIGDYAFNGCYSMQSVVLPKKLESIGYCAFCDCASLTEIVIPGTVTYIADEAFVYCRSLEKVVLQKGVLDIGYGAFAGCTALQSIVLPSTLLSISSYAFAETGLTEITIPKSVEYVGGAVFAGAESLETIYCEADDIGYWEPYWLDGCDATVVWGVASDEECLYGDVNGDGKITGMDVTRLLRYIANRNPVTGESSVEIGEGSDCNGDGKITGMDVTRLLRYIANRNPITGESSVTLGPSK